MVRINKLLLLSTFSFIQGMYGYCVYNKLTDGSSFYAMHIHSGAPSGKSFFKHMEKDSMFCCPYTQKDCSCNLKNDDLAEFEIKFYFETSYPLPKYTNCTTGGALIIHGTQEKYYSECIDASGISTFPLLV